MHLRVVSQFKIVNLAVEKAVFALQGGLSVRFICVDSSWSCDQSMQFARASFKVVAKLLLDKFIMLIDGGIMPISPFLK
ncbi:hypothetical protein ACMYR3_08215 [Ampullimonas aquatilis]|uniref:hypothetical protein n=1 Tax=Ampullimonas aquatilis TaxID=1341549 RepID=UPI003C72C704